MNIFLTAIEKINLTQIEELKQFASFSPASKPVEFIWMIKESFWNIQV